jgi:hypothetical protein
MSSTQLGTTLVAVAVAVPSPELARPAPERGDPA